MALHNHFEPIALRLRRAGRAIARADQRLLDLRDARLQAPAAPPEAAPDVDELRRAVRAPVLDPVGDARAPRPDGRAVAPDHGLHFDVVAEGQGLRGGRAARGRPVVRRIGHAGGPLRRAAGPGAGAHVDALHVALAHFDEAVPERPAQSGRRTGRSAEAAPRRATQCTLSTTERGAPTSDSRANEAATQRPRQTPTRRGGRTAKQTHMILF